LQIESPQELLDKKHHKHEIKLNRNKHSTCNMLILAEVKKESEKLTHWYSKKTVDSLYSYVKPEIQESTDDLMLRMTLNKFPGGKKFESKLDNYYLDTSSGKRITYFNTLKSLEEKKAFSQKQTPCLGNLENFKHIKRNN